MIHHLRPTPQEADPGLLPLLPAPPLSMLTLPPQPPLGPPLHLFAIMSSFFTPDFLDLQDFSTNFLVDVDFGAEFNFGKDINFFANNSNDTIGAGLYKYAGVSREFSVEGSVQIQ
jgi:hypothetical protein